MPTMGWLRCWPPIDPSKGRAGPVVEDPAVRRDQVVAVSVRRRGHAHHRLVEVGEHRPTRGTGRSEPKAKTPPSAATSQQPWPPGAAAMPTTGRFGEATEPVHAGCAPSEGGSCPKRTPAGTRSHRARR